LFRIRPSDLQKLSCARVGSTACRFPRALAIFSGDSAKERRQKGDVAEDFFFRLGTPKDRIGPAKNEMHVREQVIYVRYLPALR
jgi:hypothetical protein